MIPIGRPESGVALLYHDVVPREQADESGLSTDGSWRYTSTRYVQTSYVVHIRLTVFSNKDG